MPTNEYHLAVYDPGGTIGWAAASISLKAFSRPEHRIRPNILRWDCGEFTGTEEEQLERAVALARRAHFSGDGFNHRTDIVSEDFELTQLIGGNNLLSPVRINAVLDWEVRKHGLKLNLQKRQMRTGITPERLRLFGFPGKWTKTGEGKDKFAAMQHFVTWLRRKKQESLRVPWKLDDGIVHNAHWDCACSLGRKYKCDLRHPRQ